MLVLEQRDKNVGKVHGKNKQGPLGTQRTWNHCLMLIMSGEHLPLLKSTLSISQKGTKSHTPV